jgi:hypothetical protein
LENLEALFPEGRALLRIRQMKVFILGIMSLDFQTRTRIFFTSSLTGAGAGIPFSCRSCKQTLYAALVEHLPFGVSFQQRISSSLIGRMGVLRMLSAVLWAKRDLTRSLS